MDFSWIDLIVIILVIRGMFVGYRRGLSGEALRFLGVFFALYLSFRFYEAGADRLVEGFGMGRRAAIAVSFGAISIVVIAFFYILSRVVQLLMQLPVLSALEKTGGIIFGGLKVLLLCFVVLIILALVKVEAISNAVSQKSYFGSIAIASVPGVYKFVARVYPDIESTSAKETVEKLPAVKQRTELDFFGNQKGAEESSESEYIKPESAD